MQAKALEKIGEMLEIINGSQTEEDKLKVVLEKLVYLKKFIEEVVFMELFLTLINFGQILKSLKLVS